MGFRVHSGWSAMVAVCLEKDGPRVLLRERPHLVETFTYEFRQPYHTAEKLPLGRAQAFIERVESESRALAERAINAAKNDLHKWGYALRVFSVLQASGRPLPNLDKTLTSHALIHTADGELFRTALAQAGESCGLRPCPIKERELPAAATTALRLPPAKLASGLTALGKPLGAPWSQDEKFAALAAWLALLPGKQA
jgi:hypothetical protein